MCETGATGNSWTRRAPGRVTFLRLRNAHGREQRNSSNCEYEVHFSTRLAKIANDRVGIRATDVALGLRRLPAGFYTVVHHSGLEWKTEVKRSSVDHDIVEWNGSIPM